MRWWMPPLGPVTLFFSAILVEFLGQLGFRLAVGGAGAHGMGLFETSSRPAFFAVQALDG
ncbi:hypothetical protein ACWDNI_36885 [Nocardia niigatensis]